MLLVLALATIGTASAEDYSGSQNDVDDDGRSVRDALDGDDEQSEDGGRSVRDGGRHCSACYHCRHSRPFRFCNHLCYRC